MYKQPPMAPPSRDDLKKIYAAARLCWRRGLTDRQIASELGVNHMLVWRWRKSQRLQANHRERTPQEKKAAHGRRAPGYKPGRKQAAQPTEALPGTEGKIIALQARAMRGEYIFCNADARRSLT
jgi:hypothetical protein